MSTQMSPAIIPIRAHLKAFRPLNDSATLIKTASNVQRLRKIGGKR
ncbi:MAG: hypothetical protein WAW36_01095 [Methylovulum miyakonense]